MKRMAKSAFGSDLYHLKAHMYGNNIENCHAEVVASGTIPIFHKHFCDNVVHRVTGNPVTKDSHSGTIGLDDSNFQESRELMLKLSNDPVMRDEWREMSFEYWKAHSDASICTLEIIENLENIVKKNGAKGAQEASNESFNDNQLSMFDTLETAPEDNNTDQVKIEKIVDTVKEEPLPKEETETETIDYNSLLDELKNL